LCTNLIKTIERSLNSKRDRTTLIFVITLTVFSIVNIHQINNYENTRQIDPNTTSLYLVTGDEPHNLSITSQIIRHQNVFMEQYFLDENPDPNLTWPQYYYDDTRLWHSYQRDDGHYINYHGPGISYLLIPGFALAGIFGAFMTISIISSLTSVFIYKFTSKLTTSKIGVLTTIIFTFATLLFLYSNQIYADVVITLFLISSLYFIFEKHNDSFHMAITGTILGFGIFLKISFITIDIVLIPFVFFLVLKHKMSWKNFCYFIGFFTLLTVFAGVDNLYTHGSWIGGGNTSSILELFFTGINNPEGYFSYNQQEIYTSSLIEIFFGKYHGLFIFSPIVILFTLGIKPLWNKNSSLFIVMLLCSILIITGYTLVNPLNSMNAGDPPFRYFIPIIPLMALLFALGFEKFSSNWFYRVLIIISSTIGVSFSLAFAFFSPLRIYSISLTKFRGDLVHSIYQGTDFMFPSLCPLHAANCSTVQVEIHPLNIYNEIFISIILIILLIGVIYSFKK